MVTNKLASVLMLLIAGYAGLGAGQSKPTVRHRSVSASGVSQQVAEAEAAIDRKDYAKAEPLLLGATEANAHDYRAWFDLGLVYSAIDRKPEALGAYQQSVAARPDFFESNLNLGLLLAGEGKTAEAAKYLRAATGLAPSDPAHARAGRFLAWYSLAKVLDPGSPQEALAAYRQASELHPGDSQLHLSQARLLEALKDLQGAEAEYQKAAQLNPKSEEALRGLVNSEIANGRTSQAEKDLRQYLQVNPASAQAHLQMARIFSSSHKYDEAMAELEAAQKLDPDSADIQRELAGNAALRGQYDVAESQYRRLLKSAPADAELHYALGTALMEQRKFSEAEAELIAAIKLNPRLSDAYGNLATVAAENSHCPLALQALDLRAKLVPENAGSYFQRASCLDHLRQYKKAAQSYRLFLSVANGRFPNQEWQARHRLLAIDPK